MHHKNIYKYDQFNRPLFYYWAVGNVLYEYIHVDAQNILKEIITCPSNKSNYKTIIKHVYKDNSWILYSKLEIGEVYCTYYKYDKGFAVLTRRFNRKTNGILHKTIIQNKDGQQIWIMNYNGKKSVGFKVDVNKLK
jgi:hypothetical protein